LVTAVIPTRNRPELVMRAVHSVQAQRYAPLEIVVVIDGSDPATEAPLRALPDARLRVVVLPASVGGSDARNTGVQHARGEWIAFLDDDDEWLPSKLESQMSLVPWAGCDEPIISSRFIARTPSGDHIWPERFPAPSEPISEYLLRRKGIQRSDGFIATPTILTRRSLLTRLPFRSGLKKHQDWDWVLRASSESTVRIIFSPDALSICHMKSDESTSRSADWQVSLDWLHASRSLVTKKAYSSFVTCHVAWQAAAQGAWSAFFPLLADAFRNGSPQPEDLVRYAGFWFVPAALRRRWNEMAPSVS
jgi:glycosyltransferase involved in cell wall biosynthesis